MKRSLAGLGALIFAMVWIGVVRGNPRIVPVGDPVGQEIRATARDFFQRISEGDAPGAKALFAGPPDHEAILDADLRLVRASKQLVKAMAPKMEIGTELELKSGAELFQQRGLIQMKRPVILNDDLATIGSSGAFDGGVDLQRIDGKWKVTHLTIHYRKAAVPLRIYTKMAQCIEAACVPVENGQLRNSREVAEAIRKMEPDLGRFWFDESIMKSPTSVAPPATQPAVDATDLVPLIGKSVQGPELQRVISNLPGLPRIEFLPDVFFIISYDAGICLTFATHGELQALTVYGPGNFEYSSSRGKLPHDLKFGDTRATVEKAIGRPDQIFGVGAFTFDVAYQNLGLQLVYGMRSGKDPLNPLCRMTILAPTVPPIAATQPVASGRRLTFRLVATDGVAGTTDSLPDPRDKSGKTLLKVSREVLLDDSLVEEVSTFQLREHGEQWAISLGMTPAGAIRLAEITGRHQGEKLAIMLDGRILVAPTINGKISRQVMIELGETDSKQIAREICHEIENILYTLPDETPNK